MDKSKMSKAIGLIAIVIALGSTITSCNNLFSPTDSGDSPSLASNNLQNEVTFAISDGENSANFTWYSDVTIGFLESYSSDSYFNIFKSENSADGPDTFYEYLFIDIPLKSTGTYNSDSSTADVSLYDSYGNLFMVFSSIDTTYIEITVTNWTNDKVTGTFGGVLYNPDTDTFWGISGEFTSFDSTDRSYSNTKDIRPKETKSQLLHDTMVEQKKSIIKYQE